MKRFAKIEAEHQANVLANKLGKNWEPVWYEIKHMSSWHWGAVCGDMIVEPGLIDDASGMVVCYDARLSDGDSVEFEVSGETPTSALMFLFARAEKTVDSTKRYIAAQKESAGVK